MFKHTRTFLQTVRHLPRSAALSLAAMTLMAAAHAQSLPQVQGEIRKVDAAAGKITIRHAQIPNLDMPGMTMVFKAAPALVARAAEGDKVRFTAERVDGALTVTSLEKDGGQP